MANDERDDTPQEPAKDSTGKAEDSPPTDDKQIGPKPEAIAPSPKPDTNKQESDNAASEADAMDEAEDTSLSGEYWMVGAEVSEDNPFKSEISFGLNKSGSPPEQTALVHRIERTVATLKVIYMPESGHDQATSKAEIRKRERAENAFLEFFSKLHSLAALGVGVPDPDPAIADAALNSLQAEVVSREAGRIKNEYMIRLGLPAMLAALGFAALFFLYQYSPSIIELLSSSSSSAEASSKSKAFVLWPAEVHQYRHMFLVLAGAMLGTWASFASRKVTLSFNDLAALEADRLDPRMRLVFVATMTIFLSLIFLTDIVDITFGDFTTDKLKGSGTVALLIGAFAGLTEQSLPTAVMERARGLIDAVNTK